MIKTHGEHLVSAMWKMSANREEQWVQVTHSECTVNTQKNGESRIFQWLFIVWTLYKIQSWFCSYSMFTCMFRKWITGKNLIWTCIKLSLCYVAGILEKELISLSIKDVETIKGVPDIVKKDLKASITDAKDTERFVIWLTAQRLPLNLIHRYEYQYACSAGMLWFYSNF